jgi:hypothetical protein
LGKIIGTVILSMWGLLGAEAQYISRVMEYLPAPGQHINSTPWGDDNSASSILGGVNGTLCLGAFGGSVVFAFANPVEDHPDNPFGVDFTIFGNPLPDWSEPGVVWVMKDENENGKADDTWYELAGSDYYFSSTLHDYQVSYTNPGGTEAMDVAWRDHLGNQGIIKANSIHPQPYYPLPGLFPNVPEGEYELTGTLIRGAVDVDHPPVNVSLLRAFGYADNQLRGSGPPTVPDNPYTLEVEHSGGDAFDIGWAVDADGNEVELDQIHFVKVQNGMLHQGGWLGELSTEITGAADVAPDPGLSGRLDMLVIKDLPSEMDTTACQLELFLFHKGKPEPLPDIIWTTSEPWAVVDASHRLTVNGTGVLTLSAKVAGDPLLQASVSTRVIPAVSTALGNLSAEKVIRIYPNPAREAFFISGVEEGDLTLFDLSGKVIRQVADYRADSKIHIPDLLPGIYLIQMGEGQFAHWLKLLKH